MNVQAILARLKEVARNGDGWTARCPAHEDHRPSLSVKQAAGGKILIHCFAGCTVNAICAAMGVIINDLFPAKRNTCPVVIATYDYCDASGKALFQVVRYDPKAGHRQRGYYAIHRCAGTGSFETHRSLGAGDTGENC